LKPKVGIAKKRKKREKKNKKSQVFDFE